MEIKDSGARRQFNSGAVRDIREGKGRTDLIPFSSLCEYCQTWAPDLEPVVNHIKRFMETGSGEYLICAVHSFVPLAYPDGSTAMLELSKHYEQGAVKYGERNWEKGIPLHCYIDSGVRHLFKWYRGDSDEPHDRAFIWNMFGAVWTIKNKSKELHPELFDIPHELIRGDNFAG